MNILLNMNFSFESKKHFHFSKNYFYTISKHKKCCNESHDNDQELPIIEYPYLTCLSLNVAHDDYRELFLDETKVCLFEHNFINQCRVCSLAILFNESKQKSFFSFRERKMFYSRCRCDRLNARFCMLLIAKRFPAMPDDINILLVKENFDLKNKKDIIIRNESKKSLFNEKNICNRTVRTVRCFTILDCNSLAV